MRRKHSLIHIISIACLGLIASQAIVQADEPTSANVEVKEPVSIEAPEKRFSTQQPSPKEVTIPSKVTRYAQFLLTKYDLNRDGVLQEEEWKLMHGHPELIDHNDDGAINLDEVTRWVANYGRRKQLGTPSEPKPASEQTPPAKVVVTEEDESPEAKPATATNSATGERQRDQKYYVPSKRLPVGLPEWFPVRDQDGDGQLTFGEFSPTGGAAELAEFESYDANGDGLVTAKECVQKGTTKSAAAKETSESRTNASGQQTGKSQRNNRRKSKATP